MNLSKSSIVEKIAFFVIFSIIAVAIGYTVYFIMHPYVWEDMWKLATNNLGFWFLNIIGIAFALWRKNKHPKKITTGETIAQVFISALFVFTLFGSFTFVNSDLKDQEFWNGKVSKAVWEEEWTEEYEICDDDGCTDYTRSHPDHYFLKTSNKASITINRSQYRNFVDKWDTVKQTGSSHIGQISFGDGRTFEAPWNSQRNDIIPSAVQHNYSNYLKASKSIKRLYGVTSGFEKYLTTYPQGYVGKYGKIELNRVITKDIFVPDEWKKNLDTKLDNALVNMGAYKQVNILVYIVPAIDRGFVHALEERWILGKKNDVIVILSLEENLDLNWADVMIFQGNQTLKVDLVSKLTDMKNLANSDVLSSTILTEISTKYTRVPMEELEYLLYDIDIPFWVFFVVLFLAGTVAGFTSIIFEQNTNRYYSRSY